MRAKIAIVCLPHDVLPGRGRLRRHIVGNLLAEVVPDAGSELLMKAVAPHAVGKPLMEAMPLVEAMPPGIGKLVTKLMCHVISKLLAEVTRPQALMVVVLFFSD